MKAYVALTLAVLVVAGVSVATQETVPAQAKSAAVVAEARRLFFQAREGHFEVVPKAVTLLEQAVAADPSNIAVLNAMAFAYGFQAAAAVQPGGNPMDGAKAGQQAFAASQRALQIDPNDAIALATHGGLLGLAAVMQQKPEWLPRSRSEIYRAVELAPSAVQPRLIRAGLGLNQPGPTRDTEALIEDLSFLSAAAEGSRAGDMEHLLLGDLYAEIGRPDDARRQYQAAARRPASAVKAVSQSRLAALEQGVIPAGEIARVRVESQSACVNCHAK